MNSYLETLSQNKNINRIFVHFGSKLSDCVFKLSTINRESFLELFKNNSIKQTIVKHYQSGNKIKQNNNYFKLIQVEDPDIVKNNIFQINDEIDSMILLYKHEELKEPDFPCKMEYHVEKTLTVIEINYIEQIKINLIDDKYLNIEIVKDAYIDNTIRELDNLIEVLQPILIDNTYN